MRNTASTVDGANESNGSENSTVNSGTATAIKLFFVSLFGESERQI